MITSIHHLKAKMLMMIAFIALSIAASGQSATTVNNASSNKKEIIRTQKIAFLTQELQLSADEAEKFWPIYNEYNAKKDEITKKKREAEKPMRTAGLDKLTDKQAEDLIAAELIYEQQLLDLKKEYRDKYKPVIGVKKIVKLFQTERKFNAYLLKQLKNSGKAEDKE